MASRSNSLVGLLCLLIACEFGVKGHDGAHSMYAEPDNVKYYVIKSHLNGLVLDVGEKKDTPGAPVFPFERNDGRNQQWRIDTATGTIRSKLNDFCMDIEGGRLVINPFKLGKSDQQWEHRGTMIVNRKESDMVLDIQENDKDPKAKVIKYEATGGLNQAWTFEQV